ncbi:uncharacterized protein [Bombus flavifrons]|uniref:uncharacterized protein n=1 Tax=Bombus flavifrons TaxID=103934 RepID=UPI003703CC90
MSGHWSQDGEAKMRNIGSTVRITLEGNRSAATIRGGPLANDVYELSEVVFRWGSSNCKGAEHTLNGTWFTMEAQAIHFNKRYETIDNCWDKHDGLAICAYFLQAYQVPTWDEHPLFSKITDDLHKVTQPDSCIKLSPNCLCWMRQACQTPGYYTYLGSITTFPFHECVTWIVFPEPVRISENQTELFRMIRDKQGTCIKENCREVQKLSGRVVYYVNHQRRLNVALRGYENASFSVSIEFSDRTLPTMRGGPLSKDVFQFMNVEFRWGPEDSLGAEHSINGIWLETISLKLGARRVSRRYYSARVSSHSIDCRYSMEAQIMHWNTRYGSIEKCFDKPDGIAVLSYLMQVIGCPGIPDNPSLTKITNNLTSIKRMGSSSEIPPDCLLWTLEACRAHGYYTYPGSLTVPPYSECVIWIISSTITKISARQIDAFRNLYDGKWKNISGNCRQQQNLHRRRILFATDAAVT